MIGGGLLLVLEFLGTVLGGLLCSEEDTGDNEDDSDDGKDSEDNNESNDAAAETDVLVDDRGLDEGELGSVAEDLLVGLQGGSDGGEGGEEEGGESITVGGRGGQTHVEGDGGDAGGGGVGEEEGVDVGDAESGNGGDDVLEDGLTGAGHGLDGGALDVEDGVDVGGTAGGGVGETVGLVESDPGRIGGGVGAEAGLETEGVAGAVDGDGVAALDRGPDTVGHAVGDLAGEELDLGHLSTGNAAGGGLDLNTEGVVGLGGGGEVPLSHLVSLRPDVELVDLEKGIPGDLVVGGLHDEVTRISLGEVVGGPDLDLVDEVLSLVVEGDLCVGGKTVLEPLGVHIVIEGLVDSLERHVVGTRVAEGDAIDSVDAGSLDETGVEIKVELGAGDGGGVLVDLDSNDVGAGLEIKGGDGASSVEEGVVLVVGEGGIGDDTSGHVLSVDLNTVGVDDATVGEVGGDIEKRIEGDVIDGDGVSQVDGVADVVGIGSSSGTLPSGVGEGLGVPAREVGGGDLPGVLHLDGVGHVDGEGLDVLVGVVGVLADEGAVLLAEGDVGIGSPAIVVHIVEVELEGGVVDADGEVSLLVIVSSLDAEEGLAVLGDGEGLLVVPASGLSEDTDEGLVVTARDDVDGEGGGVGLTNRVGGDDAVGEGADGGEVTLELALLVVEGDGGRKGGSEGDGLVAVVDGELDGVDVLESVGGDGVGGETHGRNANVVGEGGLDGGRGGGASTNSGLGEEVGEIIAVVGDGAAGSGGALESVSERAGGGEAVSVGTGATILAVELSGTGLDDDVTGAADDLGVPVAVVVVAAGDLDGDLGAGAAALVAASEGVDSVGVEGLSRSTLEPARVGLDVDATRRLGRAAPGISTTSVDGLHFKELSDSEGLDIVDGDINAIEFVVEVGDGLAVHDSNLDDGAVAAAGDGVGVDGAHAGGSTGDDTGRAVDGEAVGKSGGDGVGTRSGGTGPDGGVGDGGLVLVDDVLLLGVGQGSGRGVEEEGGGDDVEGVEGGSSPLEEDTVTVGLLEVLDGEGVVADLGDGDDLGDHGLNATDSPLLEEELVVEVETDTIIGVAGEFPVADLVEVEVAGPGSVDTLVHIGAETGAHDTIAVAVGIVDLALDSEDTRIDEVVGEVLVAADIVVLLDSVPLGEGAGGGGLDDDDLDLSLAGTSDAAHGDGVLAGDGGGSVTRDDTSSGVDGDAGREGGVDGVGLGVAGGGVGEDVVDGIAGDTGDDVVGEEGGGSATNTGVGLGEEGVGDAGGVVLEVDVDSGAVVDIEPGDVDEVLSGGQGDGAVVGATTSGFGADDGGLHVVDVDAGTIIGVDLEGVVAGDGGNEVADVVGAPEITETVIEAGDDVAAVGALPLIIEVDGGVAKADLAVVVSEEVEGGVVHAGEGGVVDTGEAAEGHGVLVDELHAEGGGEGAHGVGGGDGVLGDGGGGGGGTADDTGGGAQSDASGKRRIDGVAGEVGVGSGGVGLHEDAGEGLGGGEAVAEVGGGVND